MRPYDEGRTLWRDEFTVWTSENSLSQVYEDTVNVSLFYGHFSSRTPVCSEKIPAVGHAVDHSVPCSITTIHMSSNFGGIE